MDSGEERSGGRKPEGKDVDEGGKGSSSRMEMKNCGDKPVAVVAAESNSQLVQPLESQLIDPEELKLESDVHKGGPVDEEEDNMKQCQLPTATSAEQQRVHPEKLRAIEDAIKAGRRGHPEPMHDTSPSKMLKQQQTTLERYTWKPC
ncbi:uncharacterized protein LOC133390027 isoform X2 [Rhineura floridana]|uniref:uncharacterized protein LOC133390027 isoform X2 n=1 Tax=Rhineura floridana TaxID=261503 RepID=UPI002AC85193|nr:uncharacterized protein LOC133390027 isoform X2 [Rhineura floridana]